MRLRVILDRLDLVAAEISDDPWNPEVLAQTWQRGPHVASICRACCEPNRTTGQSLTGCKNFRLPDLSVALRHCIRFSEEMTSDSHSLNQHAKIKGVSLPGIDNVTLGVPDRSADCRSNGFLFRWSSTHLRSESGGTRGLVEMAAGVLSTPFTINASSRDLNMSVAKGAEKLFPRNHRRFLARCM